MVTITCQESGIEFEAETRRTKQHPSIRAIKDRANKDGNYREVNEALAAVRKAGGYETIEQFMALVQAHLDAKKVKQAERDAKHKAFMQEQEKIEAERKAARKAQNETLKASGYVWRKETVIADDWALEMRDPGTYWTLHAPDGREVTVEQALDEIKRGSEVVLAEIEEAKQAAEAKARAEREEKARLDLLDTEARQRFDAAVKKIEAMCVRVEIANYGDIQDRSVIRRMALVSTAMNRRHDQIRQGKIAGYAVYVITEGTGYDDDGYVSHWMRAEDAEAAGVALHQSRHDDLHKRFSDIFGGGN